MKKLTILILIFILTFNVCSCSTSLKGNTDTSVNLSVNNKIGGVTYLTSEDWEKENYDENSLSFVLPNNDMLYVQCFTLDANITDYTEKQIHNLLDEVTSKPQNSNVGDFVTNHKEYVVVAGCYGVFEDYEQIVGDVHNYNLVYTFIDDNLIEYSFSYQSIRPITDENQATYDEVIESILIE